MAAAASAVTSAGGWLLLGVDRRQAERINETLLAIAEKLRALGVPIAFAAGNDMDEAFRRAFPEAPVLAKPYAPWAVGRVLAAAYAPRSGNA